MEKGAKCGFYVTVTQKSGNFSTEEGFPHLWLCLALESHGKRGLKFQQKPPKKGQNAKGLRGPSCQLDFPRDSSRQECPVPGREALESQPPTEPPQIPADLGSGAQKAANSQISNPREEPLDARRVRATGEKEEKAHSKDLGSSASFQGVTEAHSQWELSLFEVLRCCHHSRTRK